ncbi:nuclear transport factor 2 family protein [Pseudoalteromonas xiamenensis]|uniref:nuclear transport factor 2 family protein n=1 Tax=Pseudoalteromonas xiamenensis TaxID=882626 RepID=UPI0027E3CDBB|nr:nuclear transport factor 2 family protein [Pseudoalteromonas xiamenensis]WMN59948.1 nuclear transport factor 2 family protein [Pseudoalteromonas xiamenensis]
MITPAKMLPFVLTMVVSATLSAKENTDKKLEELNLEKALYCMEILENRPDLETSIRLGMLKNECFAENYIQHAPHIPDGRDAVLSVFEQRYKKYPKLSMSVKRSAAEGDLVWLHLHVKHTPDALGAALIHIFRMEEGKIAEHWGVGQPVPKETKNNNTMF